MRRFYTCSVLAAICAVVLAASGAALAGETPEFPQNQAQWINGSPLSLEAVKGKVVFLWFFDADCPTCRGKWPGLMQTAHQFDGKPVLFVGVTSGKPREQLEKYVKETGLTWPVIVDTSREFETAAGIRPIISLQNIHQVRIISANGKMSGGNYEDIAGEVTKALVGAAWKIDPAGMPESLLPAWTAVEFGNYSQAAAMLKRLPKRGRPEMQEFVEQNQGGCETGYRQGVEHCRGCRERWREPDGLQDLPASAAEIRGIRSAERPERKNEDSGGERKSKRPSRPPATCCWQKRRSMERITSRRNEPFRR